MKKSILQFSVIAAIAASMTLTTSCSSDESVAEAYVPEAVQFSVGLGDLSVSRASSRAQASDSEQPWNEETVDGKFAAGDIISIYTQDADDNWYMKEYKVSSATGTANDSTSIVPNENTTSKTFYWKNTSRKQVYEAYSFGSSTSVGNTAFGSGVTTPNLTFNKFTIGQDQSVVSNATDSTEFLYGYGTIVYDSLHNDKLIKLGHQLARIDVKIYTPKATVNITSPSVSKQTQDDLTLKIGKVDSTEMVIAGTFKKPSAFTSYTAQSTDQQCTDAGTWDLDTSSTGTIIPRVIAKQKQAAKGTETMYLTTYSAIVIPQDFKNIDLFTITYDGATYIYKPNVEEKMEPGKHYTYEIVVGPTAISVTKAQIAQWTTDTTTDKTATAVLQ